MPWLKLVLEQPRHGWLQVHVTSALGAVAFIASDVPNNPVMDLISALGLALREENSLAWWNLEPDGYYFEFTPSDQNVRLSVSFAHNSARNRRQEVFSISGTKQEILLPIWRALQCFVSLDVQERDWRQGDYAELLSIGKALRIQPVA